ncbi:MAG: hypothetical protein AB1650_08055 [Candidatus Omnitrophota bacterium]
MRKGLLSAVMVLALMVSPVFAQEPAAPQEGTVQPGAGYGYGMKNREMMGRGKFLEKKMMMGKMCAAGDIMKIMMKTTVTVTPDGGVIVLRGNSLAKYDKNLNLVKEVQLKDMTEEIQQKMQKMMKECPVMQQRMGDDDMMMEPEEMEPEPAE